MINTSKNITEAVILARGLGQRMLPGGSSACGECDLPEAVQFGLSQLGPRFKTIPFRIGVRVEL